VGLFGFGKKPKAKGVSITITAPSDKQLKAQYERERRIVSASVIPAEKRAKTAYPDSQGLYPHELIVLSQATKFYTNGNTFQHYWWDNHGIRNVQKVLDDLLKRGFLAVGGMKETLGLEKVADLKTVLEKHNLKVSGKKEQLIDRLVGEVPNEVLEKRFKKKPYVLSENGNRALSENHYITHSTGCFDKWEMNRLIHQFPSKPYRDIIWQEYNERSRTAIQGGSYASYRNLRFDMASFLAGEDKYNDALKLMAEVLFWDLSDCHTPESLKMQIEHKIFKLSPYEKTSIVIAPGVINAMVAFSKKANLNDEQFRNTLKQAVAPLTQPVQFFTRDEYVDIFFWVRDSNETALKKVFATANKRFDINHPNAVGK
jgi:hypothetical protein